MTLLVTIILALVLDRWLGEPRRFHPLVGFGKLAKQMERRIYRDSKSAGLLAVFVLLIPLLLLAYGLTQVPGSEVMAMLALYLALGGRSLWQHAEQVRLALESGDTALARDKVSLLVSRNVSTLDAQGIASATVESVLENGNDAVFAALFWFALAGVPGVVLYRLSNTLDAMWGYRNDRYHQFGWAAARLDDLLNFIPARLTALSYALAGQFRPAMQCWMEQGRIWKSPNAGPVMAAGAGSLGVSLGGAAVYHGHLQSRPVLGRGPGASARSIADAQTLLQRAALIWVLALFLLDLPEIFI